MSEENNEQPNNEQPEVEGVDTGIEGVKADDLYKGTPVFDVSQEEFFKNMRQERNKLRFKNGSAVSQFMQQSKYRKPFYIRANDSKGEKILKKFK
jgi:hypothetical protein